MQQELEAIPGCTASNIQEERQEDNRFGAVLTLECLIWRGQELNVESLASYLFDQRSSVRAVDRFPTGNAVRQQRYSRWAVGSQPRSHVVQPCIVYGASYRLGRIPNAHIRGIGFFGDPRKVARVSVEDGPSGYPGPLVWVIALGPSNDLSLPFTSGVQQYPPL